MVPVFKNALWMHRASQEDEKQRGETASKVFYEYKAPAKKSVCIYI